MGPGKTRIGTIRIGENVNQVGVIWHTRPNPVRAVLYVVADVERIGIGQGMPSRCPPAASLRSLQEPAFKRGGTRRRVFRGGDRSARGVVPTSGGEIVVGEIFLKEDSPLYRRAGE